MLNDAGTKKTMERKAFLYCNVKLRNSNITNRNYFGSGKVYFYLTGTYMNDPYSSYSSLFLVPILCTTRGQTHELHDRICDHGIYRGGQHTTQKTRKRRYPRRSLGRAACRPSPWRVIQVNCWCLRQSRVNRVATENLPQTDHETGDPR